MEKISLYIPCYNAGRTLGACLEAALRQSLPPEEVLVVDDGSTDASVSVAGRYPVRVIRLKENRGLGHARNTAFFEARNSLVAALDADCVAGREWLARLAAHFRDSGIVAAGGRLLEKEVTLADKWRAVHMAQSWGEEMVFDPPFLFGSNTLLRKSAVIDAGLYDPALRTNFEDVDISRRLVKRGRIVYDPGACCEHIRTDSPVSVVVSYCRWNSREINPAGNSVFSRALKPFLRYAGLARRTLLSDLVHARFGFLALDFLFILFYPALGLRKLIYDRKSENSQE